MERSVIETMSAVLNGKIVPTHRQRDALLACLDLTSRDDESAAVLRAILEDAQGNDVLETIRASLAPLEPSVDRGHRR